MSTETDKIYDAVVVLGKNLGVGWSKDKIRKQREHLAPHGRVNTDAGGIFYKEGKTKKIIFSTGTTVPELPSEAKLMKDHLQRIWPQIPNNDVILEEVSKQTKGNASEVAKLLEKEGINPANVGLITMGFHMNRAQKLFREQGLNLDPLPSEDILGEKFTSFIDKYKRKPIYFGEQFAEFGYRIIQSIPGLKDIAETYVEDKRS